MLENDDTAFPMSEADEHGDTQTRTLALLRRILVGNGYRFEQIDLVEEESKEIIIQGRFDLQLSTAVQNSKTPGLSSGGENQVFHVRDQYTSYLNTLDSSLQQDGEWLEHVRGMTVARPEATWGLKGAKWPLDQLAQTVALVLPCDRCNGAKVETCQACNGHQEISCQHCYEKGQITCPHCRGTGSDPQSNGGNPCPQCRGMRHITCPHCHGRGRIVCRNCQGKGQITCTQCQGHGFFTETSRISVTVSGTFRVSAPSPKPPDAVLNLLDRVGVTNLREGHALIIADPTMKMSAEPSIFSQAILPYARYTLKLDGEDIEVQAVGLRPMLAQFPTLLDQKIGPILSRLTLGTLPDYCQQFRLVRELTEAMAAGTKPRTFFVNRYPYGISPQVGMTLANQIRALFAGATSQPRIIAAAASTAVSAGLIYFWLSNPRPEFLPPSLPISVSDTAVISILAFASLAVVEFIGRKSLRNLLSTDSKVASTGGYVGMGAFAAVMLIGILLLWLPDIRPEWVNAIIYKITG